MGTLLRSTAASALLAVLSSAPAWARPELAEPPHFLDLEEVERVVFFAGEAIPGALATTLADGTIEVTVPGVGVGKKLEGRTFQDVANATGKVSATVEETDTGDIRILLRPSTAGVRARAYAATQPPRLVIDLSTGKSAEKEATAKAVNEHAPAATTEKAAPVVRPTVSAPSAPAAPLPVATQIVSHEKPRTAARAAEPAQTTANAAQTANPATASRGAAEDTETERDTAPAAAKAPGPSLAELVQIAANGTKDDAARSAPAKGSPAQVDAPKHAPANGAPTQDAPPKGTSGHTAVTSALAAVPPAQAPDAAPPVTARAEDAKNTHTNGKPSAPSGAVAAPAPGAGNGDVVPVAAPATLDPNGVAPAASAPVICLWTRVKGLPFCAPDPESPLYADPELAQAASDLTRGRIHGLDEVLRTESGGARRFLGADRLLVEHAGDGWLLSAAKAYEEALRAEPDYGDATRARVNLALVYRAMGFAPEVRQLAVRNTAAAPVARALLGELLIAEGRRTEGQDSLLQAADAGGLAACLAARGLVELALLEGDGQRASTGLAGLPRLCPDAVVSDPETERLQAILRARGGDSEAAIARLDWLEKMVHPSERGRFIETIAEVAEGAGQKDRARRAYDRLAGGEFGASFQRLGTVGLARLDADSGQLAAGLRRLDELDPDGNGEARREVMAGVSGEVLKEGGASDAVALLYSENVDPQSLSAEQQILLARRYRELGFPEYGSRLLLQLRRSRPPAELPVDLWAELGENALAHGDGNAGVGAADDWRARSGENGGELGLRMRALAQLGAAAALVDQAGASLDKLDPTGAAKVRVDLARRDLGRDPARARALAAPAVAPEVLAKLSPSDAAAALWVHAQACERSGDATAAVASFKLLVETAPKSPAAGSAGYRLARLAAQTGDSASAALGYGAAEKGGDPLTKRVAVASRTFDEIVGPLAMERTP